MATATYTAAAGGYNKQVQWLVEIDLDRCGNDYTSSPCTASDAGDGSRCWYSFLTCQDPANFNKGTKTYRFCLNEVPWSDPATAVYPLLRKMVGVPQRVDPEKLFAYPEKVSLEFALDHAPLAPDADKTLHNTAIGTGEFWRNLFSRNQNYPGRAVRIKRGFNETGFVLADFEQIGPEYKLKAVRFGTDSCTVEVESPLADLNKRQIPMPVSGDNLLQADITDSATSLVVNDASEFPDPSDYSRNTLYVEIESEIIAYTTRDTGTNTLGGLTRGAFGTSAAAHTASNNLKVAHVCCFGTSAGAATYVTEVMQDLLEWAGVPSADVNDTTFDTVKDEAYPNAEVLRTIRKSTKVSKLMQQLREVRGIIVYIDAGGQFAASVMGPGTDSTLYDDDSFVENSMSVVEDEDQRVTRVGMYYDPTAEDAKEPADFSKAVIVINIDLETANSYGDQKEDVVLDHWSDPDLPVASVRNLARRVITRRRNGVRSFTFRLEVKDGLLNVGDEITVQTRRLTGLAGEQLARPALITARKEVGLAQNEYEAVDTNYNGNYFRISPDGTTENYDSATEAERQYGYMGDNNNRLGTTLVQGYIFW